MATSTRAQRPRLLLDMNGYQWMVLFAAWLGWGFDVFDGLLFNYVAPNCVPTLLGLPLGSAAAKSATLTWTGILTSLLLIGWATGGIIFGRICDQIGRKKTLLLTMVLYAAGTSLCAIAPNMWALVLFRAIASLGIGGEWAAGASMVAEVVPEKRRIEAGAILATASPVGLYLATFVTFQVQGVFMKDNPEMAWRYVFLAGLIPVAASVILRRFLKEPERWHAAVGEIKPRLAEIFEPKYRAATLGGFFLSLVALLTWWSVNTFTPVVATELANKWAAERHMAADVARQLGEEWKKLATSRYNVGGVLGSLLVIPIARRFTRRQMFGIYYVLCAIAVLATFGLKLEPPDRLWGYFAIGVSVQGIFACFTFFLPELFPTRLRGTGSGFCYNSGRFVAALGPFLVGSIAALSKNVIDVLVWAGFIPLLGFLVLRYVSETKDRPLADV